MLERRQRPREGQIRRWGYLWTTRQQPVQLGRTRRKAEAASAAAAASVGRRRSAGPGRRRGSRRRRWAALTAPTDAADSLAEQHSAADGNTKRTKESRTKPTRASSSEDRATASSATTAQKAGPRNLSASVDPTQEWAENNYYHLPHRAAGRGPGERQASSGSTTPSTTARAPFLSTHLADASRNFTEMMFALAVLDLPFEAGQARRSPSTAGKMTFTPAGPGRSPSTRKCGRLAPAAGKTPILVSQNFYRARRPLPRGERREGRQVRHRRIPRSTPSTAARWSSPTRRSLAAEADGAGAVADRAPSRWPTASSPAACRSTWSRTARRRSTTLLLPRAGQVRALPGPRRSRTRQLVVGRAPSRPASTWSPSRASSTRESWDYVSQNGTPRRSAGLPEPRERTAPRPGPDRLPHAGQGVLRGGARRCCGNGTSTSTRSGPTAAVTTSRPRRGSSCCTPTASWPQCGGPIDSAAAHGRSGRPASVRAPGVQAAGQRPRARPGPAPADRQRPGLRAVPPVPQAADLSQRSSTTTTCWPRPTTCCCRTASRRRWRRSPR